ncbi:MAG: hypothetical protein HY825_19960 [Acidobacteria bacterium]|nr:hypothetical protein [Acidobacteriota bacterium]
MRGMLAVASRELVERRNAFVAAAVAAVLPLLAPILSGTHGGNATELRAVAALTVAVALAAALAMAYGAATISGELEERRLGFFFARPLSGLAIWGGKFLAGVVMVWVAPAIVLLPTWLASPSSEQWNSIGDAWLLLVIAPAAVFLLALAQAAGVAIRARSPWLVVDVVMLVVVTLLVRSMALRLLDEGATEAWTWTLAGLVIAVPLAVIVAGAVQVVQGRTDLYRGHRVLSLTLWSSLLAVSLVGQSFSWWVVHPTIADLRGVESVHPAPQGSWFALAGPARGRGGYVPGFLLDVDHGRSVKLQGSFRWELPVTFSADGRHAAWLVRSEARGSGVRFDLMTIDLRDERPRPRSTLIGFTASIRTLTLSPDGRRLAAVENGTLSVSDAYSGDLLAAVRLPADRVSTNRMWFAGDGTLRFPQFEPSAADRKVGAVVITEFDVASGRLRDTGRIAPAGEYEALFLRLDPRSNRILRRVQRPREGGPTLHDATTGALLADLVAPEEGWRGFPAFLADGGIAVAETREGRARLRVFTSEGAPLWSIDLGAGYRAFPAGERAPGRLLVVVRESEDQLTSGSRSVLVDLDTRNVEPLPSRLIPAGWMPLAHWWWDGEAAPGSVATRTFITADRGLVALDPVTGASRVVVAGGPPAQE